MGVFGGIKGAKYSEGGVYLVPGVYRLKILICKYIKTAQHSGAKDAFVAEFEVLESNVADRPSGSTCSWMVTLDKLPALGNIKQFLLACLPDATEDQIDESAVEFVVNEQKNPLKDYIVRCSAVNIKTKANRDFTKCKFLRDADGAAAAAADQASAAA